MNKKCVFTFDEQSIDEEIKCPICQNILLNPVYHHSGCANMFCEPCLNKSLTNNKNCPLCRVEVKVGDVIPVKYRPILEKIGKAVITCGGCSLKMTKKDWVKHVNEECSDGYVCSANDKGCCVKANKAEMTKHEAECITLKLKKLGNTENNLKRCREGVIEKLKPKKKKIQMVIDKIKEIESKNECLKGKFDDITKDLEIISKGNFSIMADTVYFTSSHHGREYCEKILGDLVPVSFVANMVWLKQHYDKLEW